MTDNEIDILVAEYNQTEQLQAARLRQLYEAMLSRKGHRRIDFSSGQVWINAFDRGLSLGLIDFVDPMSRTITNIQKGAE